MHHWPNQHLLLDSPEYNAVLAGGFGSAAHRRARGASTESFVSRGGLRDLDAQLEQFAMDLGRGLGRIRKSPITREFFHRRTRFTKKALVNQAPSTHDPERIPAPAPAVPRNHCPSYLVIIRLDAALGICSAGEIVNVAQAFQPSGRAWSANSK